jgi:nucleotide-binding universal stress UspA family protein
MENPVTTTTTPRKQASHTSWEYERTTPCGIVVGVDGSAESIAALNSAASIARFRRCALHVVSVLPPFANTDLTSSGSAARSDELRIELRTGAIRELLRFAGAGEDWTHEVVLGRPAKTITRIAEMRCADLIVVGRHEHSLLDRISGGETTLQVMRLSPVPVIAVSADMESVRSIVVATDFSPASLRAAKAALPLLRGSGAMYLVYVEPPVELLPQGFAVSGDTRYPGDVVVWFRRFTESLAAPPGVIVEGVVLNGKPAPAALEFAERVGAGLIAAGSHAHSRMERFILGSVSTDLVRNAGCPVLIAPAGN